MSMRAKVRKAPTMQLTPFDPQQNSIEVGQGFEQGFDAPKLSIDDLTPDEQAAAMSGAEPDQLVGLNWLNNAHHEQLVKSNALSDTLARRIEAHRIVSERASAHNM